MSNLITGCVQIQQSGMERKSGDYCNKQKTGLEWIRMGISEVRIGEYLC